MTAALEYGSVVCLKFMGVLKIRFYCALGTLETLGTLRTARQKFRCPEDQTADILAQIWRRFCSKKI